jgi:hypothetical protein
MRKYLTLLIVFASSRISYADSWVGPEERLYFSANSQYVANVIPADTNNPAKLKVFGISSNIGWVSWQCNLGNEGAPQVVFVSDDGKYVVTVNENSSRVFGGMGDYVLAFYQKKGLIKNYSLEQILHYPDRIDVKEFNRLTIRSVSGRAWNSMPMLLEQYNDKLYISVWLLYGKRWLAWDVSTGDEVKINDALRKYFNEKGLQWARKYNIGEQASIASQYSGQALDFLGIFKRDEDRKFLESFLGDSNFHTWYVERDKKFISYYSWSDRRSQIDKILAEWDGHTNVQQSPSDQEYYYLGVVKGTIELPRVPKAGDNYLCIYLIPSEIDKSKWFDDVPIHRLCTYFGDYSFHDMQWPEKNIPFSILGVTPGEYRITAVWDLGKAYNFGDNYINGLPQKGDYQSKESPLITVKAGETTGEINIDCLQLITNPTN